MGYITFPLSKDSQEQLRIIQSRFANAGPIVILNDDDNTQCSDILNEMINRHIIADAEINGANAYQIIGKLDKFFEWISSKNEEVLSSTDFNLNRRNAMNSYERLNHIINQIDSLIDKQVTSDDPNFQAWKSETNRFLIGKYGEDSYEYKEFNAFPFAPLVFVLGEPDSVNVDACRKDLERAKAILQGYLIDVSDESSKTNADDSLDDSEKTLIKLFSRFHRVALQIQKRHENRNSIIIKDEYDVQDLLHSLMKIFFDDVRAEEWTPSYAGKSARMDFLLKQCKTVVEVKKTRQGLSDKELGDQLIDDVERYKSHPDCNRLFCFVYDPEGRIDNPEGLMNDLNHRHMGFARVIIEPRH